MKIIEEWLMDNLGLMVKFDENFGEQIRDGYLIGKVLCCFDVISKEEFAMLEPTNDKKIALDNFTNHVLQWLGKLDIQLLDAELDDIIDGKTEAAFDLFFELYLTLQNRSKLHFITSRRAQEKCRRPHDKFHVKKVTESILDHFKTPSNPNAAPLRHNKDVLKWHKDRLALLKKQCENARREYRQVLDAKKLEKPPKNICVCDLQCLCPRDVKFEKLPDFSETSEDLTYEDLMKHVLGSKRHRKHVPNREKADEYVMHLKRKREEMEFRECRKMKLHTEFWEEIWNGMSSKQERKIDELVDEKVLMSSFCEKQMINKMMQVKHQQQVIEENRRYINEEITKQHEQDILQKLLTDQRLTDECICDYLYERERIKQLHRRIYAEKQRLKRERHRKLCREIADDLANLALRIVEYKELFGESPPKGRYQDWVSLFVKSGPILPIIKPAEEIVQDLSELMEEEEQMYIEEIERQEIMDEKDFEKYDQTEWPWEMTNVHGHHKIDLKLIERGMHIIGFIVHRLLRAKYPTTPMMPKPDFKFEYSVCINGLTDTSIIERLQNLLNHKDIVLFEVHNVINFCLEKYVKEQKPEEHEDLQSIDLLVMEEKKKVKVVNPKLQKGKKGKNVKESTFNSSKSAFSTTQHSLTDLGQMTRVNKKFQTPQIFPCEEVKMSNAAQLGEVAQNCLDQGQPLTDYLLAAMIVEYLYSVSDKKGWALINYPSTYNQAATLEENLSSTPLNKDINAIKSIMDLTELEDKCIEERLLKEKDLRRYSKIFPLPPKLKEDDVYDTMLTAYIKIMKTSLDEVDNAESDLPPVIKFLEHSANSLEMFYAEQGCCYFLYYENFDYDSVKYLARLIIGDFSLPRKPSIELFGKSLLLGQDDTIESSAYKLPKVSKEISAKEKAKKKLIIGKETDNVDEVIKPKGKKGKKTSKSSRATVSSTKEKVEIPLENKEVQVPALEDIFEIVVEEEDPEVKPGEEKWKYLEIPMSEEVMVMLAKMCENMEKLYIEDLKQVFFMRRMILNTIQPYVTHIRNSLLEFIRRPDDRQGILHEFQETFNAITECLRIDDEVKAELHCRVDELRAALANISEANIMESFAERNRIIEQHWLRRQLHELSQVYIAALQLEIDRFVDTIQLLTDYYVSGITTQPPEEAPFLKELIRGTPSDNIQAYESYTQWEDAFDIRYFTEKISQKIAKASDLVEKTKTTAIKVTTTTQGKFSLGKAKPDKQKGKGSIIEMSDVVRDNMDKIVDEWKTAIEGEVERVNFRFKLIEHDSRQRFREMSAKVKTMMNEIYSLIRQRYNNEQSSIEQVCNVCSNAIENETAIQIELVLDRDEFYVQPEVLLFADDLPPPPPPVKEWKRDSFTMDQLRRMRRVLIDLAPLGTMPERMFAFLLQDMLVQDVEDGHEPPVPELWRKLTTLELDKVLNELFSKTETIHWRDFIIFNLMIKMPTMDQLLEMRREFARKDRTQQWKISVEDFRMHTFWFEEAFCTDDESDMKRLENMKDLLCEMYKTDKNTVHYCMFLLDFCKDHVCSVGFAKLLALILNRPVCFDFNIGKKYVQHVLLQRESHEQKTKARDAEINENNSIVRGILDEITDETVHQCDSVVITDVQSSLSTLSMTENSCGTQCICDMRCYCAEKQVTFSNVPIDFEASFDPALVYFLNFETILAAEAAVLHWHAKVENIDDKSFRQICEKIFNECKNPNFNNAVLAHEFLNEPKFSQLLANTTRFTDKNASHFVQNIINFRKN